MRILVCSWRDINNPGAGGAERVTFEHMRRWVAAGHDVVLFTASYSGARCQEIIEGIHITRRGGPFTVRLAAWNWYRRAGTRPDLVVDEIHGIPFASLAYTRVPVVAWIYEVARDIWRTMYPLPLALVGTGLESAALRRYASAGIPFVTDSNSTANDLETYGVRRSQITVIPPAINCRPVKGLPEKESSPTLIFLGRLVRMKGVADAIVALSLLRASRPDARLWIIGNGSVAFRAELQRLVMQLGVDDAVQFLGHVGDEEKWWRLQRAHFLVHPSQREGWGINVIEANAMGTPAIAYEVQGLRDSIVDGVTGVLCADRTPVALASAVAKLLSTPLQYEYMQRKAVDWSSRFSWDAAAATSLGILEQWGEIRLSSAPA